MPQTDPQTEFVLKDVEGTEHLYTCKHFTALEQYMLQLKVAKIAAGPAGPLIRALMPAAPLFMGPGALSTKLAEVAKLVDWSLVPDGLAALPGALLDAGGDKLIKQILGKTTRQHQELDANEQAHDMDRKLDTAVRIDLAYQRGNLAEMFKAVGMVLLANLTPFGASEFIDSSELSAKLTTALPVQRKRKPGTTQPKSDTPPASPPPAS